MIEGRIIITNDLNSIIKNNLDSLREGVEDRLTIEIRPTNIDEIIETAKRLRDVIEVIITTRKIDKKLREELRKEKIKTKCRRIDKIYTEDRIYMYHNNKLYEVYIAFIFEEYEPPKRRDI